MARRTTSIKLASAVLILLVADTAQAVDLRGIWSSLKATVTRPFKGSLRSGNPYVKNYGEMSVEISPRAGGREVKIVRTGRNPDGSTYQVTIEAPPVSVEASAVVPELNYMGRLGESVGVTRKFGKGAEQTKISQSFRAEEFDQKMVRVQIYGEYDSKILKSTAFVEKNKLRMQVVFKGKPEIFFTEVPLNPVEGVHIIRFQLRGDGTGVSLFTLIEGHVVEVIYSFSRVPGPTAPSPNGTHPMQLVRTGYKKLTEKEIAAEGFFKVSVQGGPARKEAGGAATGGVRRMHVEDEPVTGAR